MTLFVDSTAQATRHAVYAIERTPPSTIRAEGASVCAIAELFPWGPDGQVYTTTGTRDFIDTFTPGGASRTGAGYMSVIGKAWPVLKVVRILGSSAAKATAVLLADTTHVATVTLKYKGVLGNSVSTVTSTATDGDVNHFDLTVTLSTATGTTQDVFRNLNYSGTGADSTPSFVNCKLVGAITKNVGGVPDAATIVCTGGVDGTIDSAAYVGTPGAADHGISLFEGDKSIDFVFAGDPGNSLRAAVNAGLVAHADLMTDRMAFINGNSALSLASVQTDVASYRSIRACYIDNWAYQNDDVDGTERIVSPAPFAVSLAANLSPSTSFSWKSTTAQKYLSSITRLEFARGNGAYTNELAGICTLQREDNGGFTFEAAVVTDAPISPAKRKYKRTRMGHYMAKAVVASLRESVDSPNVAFNQQDEVNAITDFLDGLKRNATTDPNKLPHIVDFAMRPLGDFNSALSLANDEFTIPADIQISSDQARIFLSLNFGETVKPSVDI